MEKIVKYVKSLINIHNNLILEKKMILLLICTKNNGKINL